MAFSLGALIIDFEARTGKFETDTGRAAAIMKKRADSIDRDINRVTQKVAKYLAVAVGGLAFAITKATREAEFALANLDNAVKATGGAAGFTTSELVDMSDSLQKVTAFSDDAIQGMSALLLSFKEIRGDTFKRTQLAVLDLATALQIDLQTAATLVGKALNNPVQGMAALSKRGIQLTEDQKKLVKQMVALGDVAGAQAIILTELEGRFGGAAAAARDTFGGAMDALKHAFGDLLENKGGLKEVTDELNSLTEMLQDPATVDAVDTFTTALITGFAKAAQVISLTAAGIRVIAQDLSALFSGAAIGDLARLNTQLEQLERRRALGLQQKPGRDTSGIDAEIKKTKDLIALSEELVSGTKTRTLAEETAASKTKKAAHEATEEFEKQSGALSKSIAIYGQVGKAAEVQYDIIHGALDDMHPSEQQHLLALAEQYDATVRQKKAVEDLAKEYEVLGNTLENTLKIDASRLQAPLVQGDVDRDEVAGLGSLSEAVQDMSERAIPEMGEAFKETMSEMTVFAEQAARNIQDTLADFLFDPFEKGLKGMLSGMIDILRRMAAEIAAANILGAFGGTSGIAGFFGSLFGGGGGGGISGTRHSGGPVSAGSLYKVQSEEYFRPRVSGEIIPLNKMKATASSAAMAPIISVHMGDMTVHAEGADIGVAQRLPMILKEHGEQTRKAAVSEVIAGLQRKIWRLGPA